MADRNDLREIFDRLSVAREDISLLEEDSATTFKNSFQFDFEPNGIPDECNVVCRRLKPLPLKLAIRSGTIINELRACLDSLACVLAERNGKTRNKTTFPISSSKELFETEGMKKIKKLSDGDKSKIKKIKPYKEGNTTLFRLHHSDIERKHIKLLSLANSNIGALFGGGFEAGGGGWHIIQRGNFNGVHVNHMRYKSGLVIPDNGEPIILVYGLPLKLGFELQMNIKFTHPKVIEGLDFLNTIKGFSEVVESTVSQFT